MKKITVKYIEGLSKMALEKRIPPYVLSTKKDVSRVNKFERLWHKLVGGKPRVFKMGDKVFFLLAPPGGGVFKKLTPYRDVVFVEDKRVLTRSYLGQNTEDFKLKMGYLK